MFIAVSRKLPPGKFRLIKLPTGELTPGKFPPGIFPLMFLNIPTRLFCIFCFFHYCHCCHWYYLKDCFVILMFSRCWSQTCFRVSKKIYIYILLFITYSIELGNKKQTTLQEKICRVKLFSDEIHLWKITVKTKCNSTFCPLFMTLKIWVMF